MALGGTGSTPEGFCKVKESYGGGLGAFASNPTEPRTDALGMSSAAEPSCGGHAGTAATLGIHPAFADCGSEERPTSVTREPTDRAAGTKMSDLAFGGATVSGCTRGR
jgi:hypothetical protein